MDVSLGVAEPTATVAGDDVVAVVVKFRVTAALVAGRIVVLVALDIVDGAAGVEVFVVVAVDGEIQAAR